MPHLALQFNRRTLSYHSAELCRATQQTGLLDVRFGIAKHLRNARFSPKSGHRNSLAGSLLCTKSGLMQCSKFRLAIGFWRPVPITTWPRSASAVLLPPFRRARSGLATSSARVRIARRNLARVLVSIGCPGADEGGGRDLSALLTMQRFSVAGPFFLNEKYINNFPKKLRGCFSRGWVW